MLVPNEILSVWEKFNTFPMETLTKAWFYRKTDGKKQRDVSLMKEHHERYGITGNCFDLAIWLLHEFEKEGIEAYPIGHDLGTTEAHVAVIAKNEDGRRYLCDLGDQWLIPVLVDADHPSFTSERLTGFFPAAEIEVQLHQDTVTILYHRPNGRMSSQKFDLVPLELSSFWKAAEISQNTIKKSPLLECRISYLSEIAHWEFYNWSSFLSTTAGMINEPEIKDIKAWCDRLHQKTGYDKDFLLEVLQIYKDM